MTTVVLVADNLRGGLGAVISACARLLVEQGSTVHIISRYHEENADIVDSATFHYVDMPYAASSLMRVRRARRGIHSVLASLPNDVAIHTHGARGLIVTWRPRRSGLIVHTEHGSLDAPSSFVKKTLGRLYQHIVPRVVGRATTVVPAPKRGWNFVWFPLALEERLANCHEPEAARLINLLWLGRLTAQKNFREFARLAGLLAERGQLGNVLVAGGGDQEDAAQSIASEMGINAQMMGHVKSAHNLLRLDVIVCLFSHYEGRPIAIEEALLAGRPVIVSDLPGIRLMVEDPLFLVQNAEQGLAAALSVADTASRKVKGEEMGLFMRQQRLAIQGDNILEHIYGGSWRP